MPDTPIRFHIEGPDGDETARELFDLLRKEFGVRPERMDRETRRRIDPQGTDAVRVTALIYAVPHGALAAADSTEAAQRTAALERVVAWAMEKETSAPAERITIQPPEGALQPLGRLEAAEFIDGIPLGTVSGLS